jgi:branched-chain amino acid transport system permease protein
VVFLQQVINGLALGGTYSLIAIGWTTVFGVVGVINWTHGEVYMISAYVGYFLVTLAHLGLVPALLVSALVGGTLAVLIDKTCYKPLRRTNAPRLAFFITALGASTFLRYSATAFWRPDARSYPKVMEFRLVKLLEIDGQVLTINSLQLYIIGLTLVIMVLLQLFLTKNKMGKAMLAASQDLQTLSLMGVESERLISLTFLISGMLGGIAGVFMGVLYAINPMMGALAGLKGWAVAIMGGVGSITGSMIGGVFLGIVENLVSGFVSSGYRDAIAFTIMIIVLLVKPTGLLGFKFEEKV